MLEATTLKIAITYMFYPFLQILGPKRVAKRQPDWLQGLCGEAKLCGHEKSSALTERQSASPIGTKLSRLL